MIDKLAAASLAEIKADPALARLRAVRRAAPRSRDNCAPCHGAGGGGAKGYPNLNDDDWLWGGTLDEIQQTIRYGVRSGRRQGARQSQMPAFGRDGMLKRDEIVSGRELRALARRICRSRPRADLAARQEGLCRQLRGLSRRRRQGQARARRART